MPDRSPQRPRLGRKPRIPGRPSLKLAPLLTGAIPDHPATVDYGQRIVDQCGMRLNGRYGTCVPAGIANSRLLTTAWLTPDHVVNWTDDQVAAFYKTQNPNFPNQDEGMVEQIALEDLHAGKGPELDADGNPVKPIAFAEVDRTNLDEIRAACAIFGGVLYGVDVTAANMDQFDAGQPWDYVARSPLEGGHAILGPGYLPALEFITWAQLTQGTDQFWQQQLEEVWVIIWPEHLGSREFQQGVNLDQLAADYKQLTGDDLPLPTPTPAPTPQPDPGAAPFPGCDPAVAAFLVRNAPRHKMTPLEYANWCLEGWAGLR